MDGRQTRGMKFAINLVTPDNGEKYAIELSNETLTNIEGFQLTNPDLTLTINRSDLEQVMMGAKTLMAMIQDGTAKVEGDPTILGKIGAAMVDFDPRFPIMPGTQLRASEIPDVDPYAVEFGAPIPE
jgi:alkyl sulfatase BDS1-like metallo-beta-lactamase superfamily hydrolase